MKNIKKQPNTKQIIIANIINIKYIFIIFLAFFKNYFGDIKIILKNLKKISEKYNIGYWSIIYNCFIKYPLLGFVPTEFFMYELFKNSHKDYLTFLNLIALISVNKYNYVLVGNKYKFKIHIKNKIPTSNLLAVYDYKTKKITHYNKPKTNRVVIKPCRGGGGSGVRIENANNYQKILSSYSRNCIVEDFIEQHSFLNKIFCDSLNTLRILTLNENNKIKVITAVLKFGRYNTNKMDHFQNGGISVDIDLESGLLLKGKSIFKYFEDGYYLAHPETGIEFYNKHLPFFKEVMQTAIDAHKLFPFIKIIGWDIAITEEGPCVVEANRIPDFLMLQIFKPLRRTLSKTLKL